MQFSGQTVAGSVNFRKPISGSNMTGYTFWYCLCCPLFLIIGHVGPPLPCNKIKLVDVPEMEYYAKDGKGEVRKSLNPTWRIFFLSQKWVTISTLSYFVLIGSFLMSRDRFAFTGRMCSRDTCMMRRRRKKVSTRMAGFTRGTWENGNQWVSPCFSVLSRGFAKIMQSLVVKIRYIWRTYTALSPKL